MTLKERLVSFLGKKPLIDESVQQERELRTEHARLHAISTRKRAEAAADAISASSDRISQMRRSFERADRRLAK